MGQQRISQSIIFRRPGNEIGLTGPHWHSLTSLLGQRESHIRYMEKVFMRECLLDLPVKVDCHTRQNTFTIFSSSVLYDFEIKVL